MLTSPSASIIIPVYNVEKYLRKCLDSVISQTLANIEIICVDDGSTDGSGAILRQYAESDPRIRVVHKENGGVSSARNEGLKLVTAKFVGFVDPDDWIEPETYALALDCFAKDPEIDVVSWEFDVVRDEMIELPPPLKKAFDAMKRRPPPKFSGKHALTAELRLDASILVTTKLFKMDIIRENGLEFPFGLLYEDNAFCCTYFISAKHIFFLDRKLYHYFRRNDSTMGLSISKKSKRLYDRLYIFKKIYDHYERLGIADKESHVLTQLFIRLYLDEYKNSPEPKKVLEKAKEIVRLCRLRNDGKNIVKRIEKGIPHNQPYKYGLPGGIFYVEESYKGRSIYLLGRKLDFRSKKVIALEEQLAASRKKEKTLAQLQSLILGEALSRVQTPTRRTCPEPVYDELVSKTLKALGPFLFYPEFGDMGDFLIAQAGYEMFDRLGLDYSIYNSLKPADLPQGKFNLVYGGGAFTERRSDKDPAAMFANRDIERAVLLPSSFWRCDDLLKVLDERFIVFCRERRSYDYCRAENSLAEFHLADDMSFFLDLDRSVIPGSDIRSIPPDHANSVYPEYKKYQQVRENVTASLREGMYILSKGGRAANFIRTDGEGRHDTGGPPSLDITQSAVGSCANKGALRHMVNLFLSAIDCLDVVVTDRLHAGIAATLLGKKTFLLDTARNELPGVYDLSMSSRPNVRLLNSRQELDAAMEGVADTPPAGNIDILQKDRLHFIDYYREYMAALGGFTFHRNTMAIPPKNP